MTDIVTTTLTAALVDEGIVLPADEVRAAARELADEIDEATIELTTAADRRDHLATAVAHEIQYRAGRLDEATLARLTDVLAAAAWPTATEKTETLTFRHDPTALTLGDLRAALAAAYRLPDDHPVQVVIPSAPSSTPTDLGTVAYPARGWLVADAHENWIEGEPGTEAFEIICDYRPGDYRRDTLRRVDPDD